MLQTQARDCHQSHVTGWSIEKDAVRDIIPPRTAATRHDLDSNNTTQHSTTHNPFKETYMGWWVPYKCLAV